MASSEDDCDWVLRLRIETSNHSLNWIERHSQMEGGYGSFSKGESVPAPLRELEKVSKYDSSRLQISFEFETSAKLEKKIVGILQRHFDQLERVRENGKSAVQIEFSIEYYGDRVEYLTLSPEIVKGCAQLGCKLHFVL